jgi:hypothetical protein
MKQLLILLLVTTACNNDAVTSDTKDSLEKKETEVKQAEGTISEVCYVGNSGKDSVFLKAFTTGELVKGDLEYRFYEKDRNKGTFNGRMNGDTLQAEYTFLSEGVESTRQVTFLRKGDQLIEPNGFVLQKTDCK